MPVIVGSERSFGILRDGGIHTHNRLFFFSLRPLLFPFPWRPSASICDSFPDSPAVLLFPLLSPSPHVPFLSVSRLRKWWLLVVSRARPVSLSLSFLSPGCQPCFVTSLTLSGLTPCPPRPVNQSINQSISRLSRIFLLPPPLPLPSPTQCRRIAQKRNRGERARQGEGEGKRETRRGDKKGKKRRGRGR